jgi:hypothetical protein
MADSAEIRIEGLALLNRNLRKVDRDLPKGMKKIHTEIAEPVAALARSKARNRSGAMAGSIKAAGTTRMARVQTGNKVYYPVQHWGWPGHNIAPDLFLTEAINERIGQSLALYEKKLGDYIDSVWVDS